MTNGNLFRLDESSKNCISEISALSGYGQNVVKECYEYLLYSWAIKLSDNPDGYVELPIPYLGTISVKYTGDEILETGELSTKVDAFVDINSQFRKLVGDIHDEGYTALVPMISKKIEQAVLVASSPMD